MVDGTLYEYDRGYEGSRIFCNGPCLQEGISRLITSDRISFRNARVFLELCNAR